MASKSGLLTKSLSSISSSTRTNIKPFESIPGPRALPFIGNIWRYLPLIGEYKPDTLVENAVYNKKKYGQLVREKITNNLTVLHLFTPEDIESLFRQDGKYPHRRSHRALLKYRQEHPDRYRDGGLFPENGQHWYRQRMQFQTRMLSKSQVLANAGKLDQVALRTLGRIDSKIEDESTSISIPNFQDILYEWALGNSLALFLDVDIYQLETATVEGLIESLHNSLASIDKTETQTNRWMKSPNKCPFYRKLGEAEQYLYNFVSDLVAKESECPQSKASSYLHNWIHVDKLDKNDITTFIIDLLLAGMHTTSYTTAFMLKNISDHDEIFKSLREEVNEHLSCAELATGDEIDGMNTLRNCLRETLRLDPVSIGTGRLVDQDSIVIDGYEIPRGTQIITQNQVISRDPRVYEQPDRFDPYRWTRYRRLAKIERPSPFATLPFGFGTRSCLGQRLSELQIKIFVARFIQTYDFNIVGRIPIKTTLIHNLNGNIAMDLTKIV